MTRRNLNVFLSRKVPEAMNPCIGTGLFQVAEMAFTGYLVKDDSGNAHRRIEMFVSVKYRSYRVSHGAGIENQYHGNLEQGGNGCTATLHTIVSVEQPHHSFREANIGFGSVTAVKLTHMFLRSHPRIQIHRRASRSQCMVLGVNVIGTAFKRLHRIPSFTQKPEQTQRERCFSAARRSGTYQYMGIHLVYQFELIRCKYKIN